MSESNMPDFLSIAVEQAKTQNKQNVQQSQAFIKKNYKGQIWKGQPRRRKKVRHRKKIMKLSKRYLSLPPSKDMGYKTKQRVSLKYAQYLKTHSTPAEGVIKKILLSLGVKFIRQRVFLTRRGFFIVDFYLPYHKTVIEVDGLQHYEDKAQVKYDRSRTKYLEKVRGLQVVRLMNKEVIGEPGKIEAFFQKLFEPLGYDDNSGSNPTAELSVKPIAQVGVIDWDRATP